MADFHYGGQAVIEGVMMRGKHHYAIAVRNPEGAISLELRSFKPLSERFRPLGWPILRGLGALIETMIIGLKSLSWSASASLGEEEAFSAKEMALSIAFALVITVVLFLVIPYYAVRATPAFGKGNILFTLVEGLLKIGIFVGYVYVISLMRDVRRLFQYHGAEHKSINALEHGEPLEVTRIQPFSTVHRRCGTTFVLVVLTLAIIVFSFLPTQDLLPRIAGKFLLLPFVAGTAYEIIKLAARRDNPLLGLIIQPGLWLQKITTREPSNDMVEVAVTALDAVIKADTDGDKDLAREAG